MISLAGFDVLSDELPGTGFYFPVMAYQNIFPVAMPVVKTIPLAMGIFPARLTLACFCPFPVSEWLKLTVPYFIKIVGIDVSLGKRTVNIGAGRNGAVNQYGTNVDSCPAEKETVPYPGFVFANISLTAKFNVDLT